MLVATSTLFAQSLHAKRGDRTVLARCTFSLHSGEVLHVLGANGSGKTTLLEILAGLRPLDAGTLEWNGTPVVNQCALYKQNVLYVGHRLGIKLALTPREQLRVFAELHCSQVNSDDLDSILFQWGIANVANQPIAQLSAGQQRRVALTRLSIQASSLWILDEPLTALDHESAQTWLSLLARHLEQGGLAIVTSHRAWPDDWFRFQTQTLWLSDTD